MADAAAAAATPTSAAAIGSPFTETPSTAATEPAMALKKSLATQFGDSADTKLSAFDLTLTDASQNKSNVPQNFQAERGGSDTNIMSNNAFGAAVEAHNALLDRLQGVEGRVSGMGGDQANMLSALKELASSYQTKTKALEDQVSLQDQRLADIQKTISEGSEAHKATLEARLAAAEADLDKKSRAIDEALAPQVRAMRKDLEELVSKQADMVSRTLPKWQAELSTEIQKLSTDLSRLQDSSAGYDRDLEEKLSASYASSSKAHKDFDARLVAEADAFNTRWAAAEGRAASLAEDFAKTSARLDVADLALSERMEAQGKQLDTFLKEEIEATRTLLDAEMQGKLTGLEDALKQEAIERLRNTERMTRDVEGLGASIISSSESIGQKIEANETHLATGLEKLRVLVDTKAANTPMIEMNTRLTGAEEQMVSLEGKLTSADEKLDSTSHYLIEQLKTRSESLEKMAKEEANNVRDVVRAEEGAKIAKLEASLNKAQGERGELGGTLEKEIQTLRAALASSQEASAALIDRVEADVTTKLEPVTQAVSSLSEDFDQLTRLQEQCEGGLTKLSDEVSGVKRKAAPIDDTQRRLLEMEWYLSGAGTKPGAPPWATASLSGSGTASSNCLSCGRGAGPHNHSRCLSPHASEVSRTGLAASQEPRRNWGSNLRGGAGLGERESSPPRDVGWYQAHAAAGSHMQPQAPNSARPSSASYHRRSGDAPEASPPAGNAFSAVRMSAARAPGNRNAFPLSG